MEKRRVGGAARFRKALMAHGCGRAYPRGTTFSQIMWFLKLEKAQESIFGRTFGMGKKRWEGISCLSAMAWMQNGSVEDHLSREQKTIAWNLHLRRNVNSWEETEVINLIWRLEAALIGNAD